MQFYGYPRENDTYGIRNNVAVMSTVICANGVVEAIGREVPGVLAMTHDHGCGATAEIAIRTLTGIGVNPNYSAVLLVGLGCEGAQAPALAKEIAKSGKWVEYLVIQDNGGTKETTRKGADIARKMLAKVKLEKRVPVGLENLIIGLECGGSDAFSGVTANPAVGVASDMLVAQGGTAIIAEITEMVGTAHILKKRAVNPEVARKVEAYVALGTEADGWRVESTAEGNTHTVAPGNLAGGLSNIVEKSLGCIAKGGQSPICDCVPYAVKPHTRGLVIMETDGYDIESIAGIVAGGAQLVLFTSGRGTPTGFMGIPVIKVISNSVTYNKMPDDIDVNAGAILDGAKTVKEVGQDIFDLMLRVANGEVAKAEANRQEQFALRQEGFPYPSLKDIAAKCL
jgi:altronate dehydratase large subunit